MNGSHLSGSASSGKIASTGHSGSHAPQSMHSSGSMTRIRSYSWMQSTGQTSTHERSLMSMQGSAMMYVTTAPKSDSLYRREQFVNHVRRALHERRFRKHLVEARLVRTTQSGGVRVAREADDRDVRIGIGDLVRLDAGDVRDHELGRLDRVRRDELMAREQHIELAAEEEIDPREQDRRHAVSVATS